MMIAGKMKAIRKAERLTQEQFCSHVDIPLNSWKKYETRIAFMGLAPFLKVVNHARFKKYTLWLTTGEVAPECGQISPIE